MSFKKPRSEGQHRKTRSNGNVKNLVFYNNNNKGFKTGVNFFDGKEKKWDSYKFIKLINFCNNKNLNKSKFLSELQLLLIIKVL